jgi:hypothetical protein
MHKKLPVSRLTGPVALIALALMAGPATAQSFGRVETTNSNVSSYFFHVQPGAATVQVSVLGTVRSPGMYEVSDGTDLGQLMALAGGPLLSPRERQQTREVTVRLFRQQSESRLLIYDAPLDDFVENAQSYPVMRDGDVLTVEVVERRHFGWRDVFPIVGAIASVALAIDRMSRF